jgi:hypothetical protein
MVHRKWYSIMADKFKNVDETAFYYAQVAPARNAIFWAVTVYVLMDRS